MLSKNDIQKLLEVFATKEDLEQFIKKEEFDLTLDKVLEKLDAVFGELKDMRQEQAFHAGQHSRITDDILEIKERVDRIQKTS